MADCGIIIHLIRNPKISVLYKFLNRKFAHLYLLLLRTKEVFHQFITFHLIKHTPVEFLSQRHDCILLHLEGSTYLFFYISVRLVGIVKIGQQPY